MRERILVTGGIGFIGTHLVRRLAIEHPNTQIEIVDDLSAFASESDAASRIEHLQKMGCIFHRMSVADFTPTTRARYEQIYHLACKVGPAHVIKFGGRMATEIVSDAEKMGDLAIRDNAPLISISTSEVYGRDPDGKPQHEDLPLEVPALASDRLEYTLAKLLTEISLVNLAKANPGLRVNLIRPFNVVGPLQTGEGGYVLPRFVDAALRNEPLTVFGEGNQTRSFTHVSDVVQSLIAIMESDAQGRIYNVGSVENTIAIGDLARMVIEVTGSEGPILHVDPKTIFGERYTEAPSKIASIDRIVDEIGWRPSWSLEEIIHDYARFARAGNVVSIADVA